MTDEIPMTGSDTKGPKTERKAVATTTWYNAMGEAESPLDSVTKVAFALESLPGRSWTLDMTDARAAMEAAGVAQNLVDGVIAFAGFGYKTKMTNEASGVRNNAKLSDAEKGPEQQGAALDDFDTDWQAGNWRAGRGEGESLPGSGDLGEALFRFQKSKGKEPNMDAIKAHIAKLDKDGRAKIRDNADIKAFLAIIRAERAQAKAGTKVEGAASADDLLAV